jgi:hypothetical protein
MDIWISRIRCYTRCTAVTRCNLPEPCPNRLDLAQTLPKMWPTLSRLSIVQMTTVHFWLSDWEHECCGDRRRVGDTIDIAMSMFGSIEASNDSPSVITLDGGRMQIVGDVRQSEDVDQGWIVNSKNVEFGYFGERFGDRVRCEGQLFEQRHDPRERLAVGHTTGRIVAIRVHEVIYERISGPSLREIGYGESREISDTNDESEEELTADFDQSRISKSVAIEGVKGRWIAVPHSAPKDDDPAPKGSIFEFVLEVTDSRL